MSFLEKNLEDIIYENSLSEKGRKMLKERGLDIQGKLYRQVEIGGFGRIDLLEIRMVDYGNGILRPTFIIYELKRNALNKDTLIQSCRYLCGVRSHIMQYCGELGKRGKPIVVSMIIGEYVEDSDDFWFLYKNIKDVYATIFSYKIDGIRFKPCDFEYSEFNLCTSDEFGRMVAEPSYKLLRDVLEPSRNLMPF